jgi:hypothetical protein
MPRGTCSICNSGVVQEINAALAKREKLRPLAAKSGFSRAALSRHGRNCIQREAIAKHHSLLFNPNTDRIIMAWPQPPDPAAENFPHRFTRWNGSCFDGQWQDSDFVIEIEFEMPRARKPVVAAEPVQNSPLSQ